MFKAYFHVFVASLVLGSQFAWGTPPPIEGYDCIFPEPANVICSGQHPGDASTANKQIETNSTITTRSISGAANGAFDTQQRSSLGQYQRYDLSDTGLAAGTGFQNLSAWTSYSRISTDNEHQPTLSSGGTNLFLFGVDSLIRDDLVLGMAFGVEDTSIETFFNAGEQEVSGVTFAPYAAFLINDHFSVDASIGYSNNEIQQFRLDSVNLTSLINGDTNSDRFFYSFNLNYYRAMSRWLFNSRLGVIYAEEDIDAVVETGGPDAFTSAARTIHFGQFVAAFELAYSAGNFEPYLMAAYENDFKREDLLLNSTQAAPANDENGFRLGLGFRYLYSDSLSVNFNWDKQFDRDDFDTHVLSMSARVSF